MKMKKSQIREAAFMLIFESLFSSETCDEIIAAAKEADEYEFNDEASELFRSVYVKAEELDAVIGEYSQKRAVSRISKVNLAILRLAVYECLFDPEVPGNVAISEAIKISQKYTFENDTKFINGILGSLSRSGKIPEKACEVKE